MSEITFSQPVTNIVNASVSALVEGLSFDTKLTAQEFTDATNLAIAQLQAAQASFGTASTDSDTVKIEKLVGYGLTIAQNSCDAAGINKYDAIFGVAENIDAELASGSFNFIAAIKNYIAAKRAEKAAQ